jgi:hypothetical protein
VADPKDGEATVPEALRAVGHAGAGLPSRPVLHGPGGTVLLLPLPGPDGRPVVRGVWLSKEGYRRLGPPPPPSLLTEGQRLPRPTADLVDLVQGAARSYLERLEALGERLDALEDRWDRVELSELGNLQRTHRELRKGVGRLSLVVEELGGPLGERFPGLERVLPRVQEELAHLEEFETGLGQSFRDLLALRSAAEANRLSEATNQLGVISNQIAAYANTSNIRMLGIAYVALVLGLVSAVVLIPNTGATILGMPSAAWVPGLWVDVILAVLAVVPLVAVFSRPWVKALLHGLGSIEARTREGVRDLPEIPAADVNRPGPGGPNAVAPPRVPP